MVGRSEIMTYEEKEAMKYFYNLRATIDESNMLFDEDIDVKCGKETIKQITIILNLIEKQSKEIEELKDESKEYQIGFVQGCYEKNLDWEGKIKAKIEEVHYKMIGHPDLRMAVEQTLQSLLEKE